MTSVTPGPQTVALVVAHPGHELIVYHWIEQHQPIYCCLTDGSGGGATSRLASTTRLLNNVGASIGPIYGRYPDKEIYRLLLERRADVFVALSQELASALEQAGVDCVAGDAVEGFNPAHDICRLIVDGAVEILRRRTGREVRNYDFLLDGPPTLRVRARSSFNWTRRRCSGSWRRRRPMRRCEPKWSRRSADTALERSPRSAWARWRPGCTRRVSSRNLRTTSVLAKAASPTAVIQKSFDTATTCARSRWPSRPPRDDDREPCERKTGLTGR